MARYDLLRKSLVMSGFCKVAIFYDAPQAEE